MMFNNQKQITVELPNSDISMEGLIDYLRRNHLAEKEEMFVQGNSVRPGIIVLVNDTDWELLDTLKYKIENNDNVTFISTLHGG